MNRIVVSCVIGIGLMVPASVIVAETTLDSDQQKYSYALGYQIGSQIQRQLDAENVELEVDAFIRGIADVLSGRGLALSQEEIMKAIETKGEQEAEKMKELGDSNELSGEAFRAEYGKQETVLRTDSGILYRALTTGSGTKPGPNDTVVVHYRGTLPDGQEFDSSYKRDQPATFSLGGIIAGWKEVLQLMSDGATWEVVIPPELGYGSVGAGGLIGPNQTLVFEIELIEVK
ncbi:MAG: FKBP-type peptidyl-prolyl cis-trans isomerase [Pseudomonadota bacterium]|nr:FKBP-type peptidyl-prolyl cis-trans isomerase [Pseudomonadota bacterium]